MSTFLGKVWMGLRGSEYCVEAFPRDELKLPVSR